MRTKTGSRRTNTIDHNASNAKATCAMETKKKVCSTGLLRLRLAITSSHTAEPTNIVRSSQNTVLRMIIDADPVTVGSADTVFTI